MPPYTTWMKTTQQDMKSMNLSLNEAIDVAQKNCPLWILMSMFGASQRRKLLRSANYKILYNYYTANYKNFQDHQ